MTDSELVQAILKGDREVFGDLVDRYRDRIFGLCRRIAGNQPDAEELAHDAFVEAFLKIGTLREPDRFGPWLRTIALNLCRAWCRRRARGWREMPADTPAPEPVDDNPTLPARMAAGLGSLPNGQRLVLVLHYFEAMSYEQMAEFLDVPIGTIMSRLHRARAALRSVLEGPSSDEESPMSSDDRFKQEVQAEIDVLVTMSAQDPSAGERLAVILRHSPERFVQLIERTEDPRVVESLATLLPRLGSTGMDAALQAAFSQDARAAGHAAAILRRFVQQSRSPAEHGWEPGTPNRHVYRLVDRLTSHAASEDAKADLLLELLDVCEDDSIAVLLTHALLCYPQAAVPRLVQWFGSVATADELYEDSWRLFALCRTGSRFCQELLAILKEEDDSRVVPALAGAEALGRCIDPRWITDVTPEQFAHDVRTRAKWPPLRRADLDEAALSELLERIAGLLDHPRGEVRDKALAALGRLRADYAKRIIPYAVHEEPSTRLAAVRALFEIGDPAAAGVLMLAARGPDSVAVRRAAIEALGRLKPLEAQDLLLGLLRDPESQVQEAAVAALAELDTPASRDALGELLASANKPVRKAAARVIYSRKHARTRVATSPASQTLAQRIRGEARPVAYSSLCEVFRLALPEDRPYGEQELTSRIAAICIDYSMTRRRLVDEGWMDREEGTYELTEAGRTAWRVERFLEAHCLR